MTDEEWRTYIQRIIRQLDIIIQQNQLLLEEPEDEEGQEGDEEDEPAKPAGPKIKGRE